ncbi:MAG: hypothetical protein V1769_00250, partial [Thermoplasmatota archaeon]
KSNYNKIGVAPHKLRSENNSPEKHLSISDGYFSGEQRRWSPGLRFLTFPPRRRLPIRITSNFVNHFKNLISSINVNPTFRTLA